MIKIKDIYENAMMFALRTQSMHLLEAEYV